MSRLVSSTPHLAGPRTPAAQGDREPLVERERWPTLAPRDRATLEILLAAEGKPVARPLLGPGRSADMRIVRLRAALGEAGAEIESIRGQGYRLVPAAPLVDLGWGRIDPARRVLHSADQAIALAPSECALLVRLAEDRGRPVARSRLIAPQGPLASAGSLDLCVFRLRQRIEEDPKRPRRLQRGRGGTLLLLDTRPNSVRALGVPRPPSPPAEHAALLAALELGLSGRAGALNVVGPPGVGKTALLRELRWRCARDRPDYEVLWIDASSPDGDGVGLRGALGLEGSAPRSELVAALGDRAPLVLVVDDAELDDDDSEVLLHGIAGLWSFRLSCWPHAGWPVLEVPVLDGRSVGSSLPELPADGEHGGAPEGGRNASLSGGMPPERGRSVVERWFGSATRRDSSGWSRVVAHLGPLARRWWRAARHYRAPFPEAEPGLVLGLSEDDAAAAVAELRAHRLLSDISAAEAWVFLRSEAVDSTPDGGVAGDDEVVAARVERWFRDAVALAPTGGGEILSAIERRWTDLDRLLSWGDTPRALDALTSLALEAPERQPPRRRARWLADLDRALVDEGQPLVRSRLRRAIHHIGWEQMGRAVREQMLRLALSDAVAGGDPCLTAAVAAELASVLAFQRGAPEALAMLAAHPMPEEAPLAERVRRKRHEGRLMGILGIPGAGLADLHAAADLAHEGGLVLLEARAQLALGQALSVDGSTHAAEPHLRRAIALSSAHGLPEQEVRASLRLAQHLLRHGLHREALPILDESVRLATRAGFPALVEQARSSRGFLWLGTGRAADAREDLDIAVDLAARLGGERARAVALSNRGLACALDGRPQPALEDLEAALRSPALPGGWYRALAFAYRLVAVAVAGGDTHEASEAAAAALAGVKHPEADALLSVLAAFAGPQMSPPTQRVGAEVAAVIEGLRVAKKREPSR